jgi:cytochrome P450
VISTLAHLQIDGEPITDGEIMEVLDLIISAGIDTTASAIACSLKYLDDDRDARQMLIENPALMPSAVEEFLRIFSPVQVLARTATRDVELGGQQISAGERVLVSWAGANVDERTFPDPASVILDRFPNRHAAFGFGVHRCIGSHFARAEMNTVISEVLKRMPDYTLASGVRKYTAIGVIQGYVNLPATFTPGARTGPASFPA